MTGVFRQFFEGPFEEFAVAGFDDVIEKSLAKLLTEREVEPVMEVIRRSEKLLDDEARSHNTGYALVVPELVKFCFEKRGEGLIVPRLAMTQ
jgi:hypothetical protein